MSVSLGHKRKARASTKAKRGNIRIEYLRKVHAKEFDSFNTNDLTEFYADLYKLKYDKYWIHESKTLCNMVFGRILGWYGPRGGLNFIASSFLHRNPPTSVTWYNGTYARDLAGDYYDHCLQQSKGLLEDWHDLYNKELESDIGYS